LVGEARVRLCEQGGICLWSLQRFYFSLRGDCCNLRLLEFTRFRGYSHSSFPVRNGSPKIASTELHLLSPLCLHLPKKAIRLELSSIWFQECTYLYSIPCISQVVNVYTRRDSVGCSLFPALISSILSSQKPITVNIKRIQKNINRLKIQVLPRRVNNCRF